MDVSIKEKGRPAAWPWCAALKAGANTSSRSLPGQRAEYYASTDGSYIDQDIHPHLAELPGDRGGQGHRQVPDRTASAAPVGMGWEYLTGPASGKIKSPAGVAGLRQQLRHGRGTPVGAEQAKAKAGGQVGGAGKWDLASIPRTSGSPP